MPSGDVFRILRNFLRRPGSDNAPALLSAAGTHVDDIVRIANYVQIMLDDNNSCTAFYQSVKDQQKRLHIQRVQTDGRLVKDKYRGVLLPPHLGCQLQPLGFATRKTWRGFSKSQIPKSQVLQNLQTGRNSFHIPTGGERLLDVHIHDLRQRIRFSGLIFPLNLFRFPAIPAAPAIRAGNFHIRQKLHIQTDGACSVAGRAAELSGIVGEISCLIAQCFGLRQSCIGLAQLVVNIGIGGHGRADIDADGCGSA